MGPNPEVAAVMERVHRYACAMRGLDAGARGSHRAIRAKLGLSQALWAQLYRGRTSMERARAIAQQLGVDPDDPSPLWLELRKLLDDMEAAGADVSGLRELLP